LVISIFILNFVAMYIEKIPNRNSPPAILLRKSWREGGKIRKRTIANLSEWDENLIIGFQKLLKGAVPVFPGEIFSIFKSLPHGHVEAILGVIKQIGLDTMIGSKPSKERELVLTMIIHQIINPDSKLACVSSINSTTLGDELNVHDADENALYNAMDWLYERQKKIENKLASKHLTNDGYALYDVSSSYYEGNTCPLIRFGYNRDGKKGKKIIVYGMLTNKEGCPVTLQVYHGNTTDSVTVPDQVEKLRNDYKLNKIVLVGDRGMITQTQINNIKDFPGIGWISALRYDSIRELFNKDILQPTLFDKQDIAEITSDEFPGERLIACFNPFMEEHREKKREALLKATEAELEKLKNQAARRKKKKISRENIALKAGKILNKYKVGKHFELIINEGEFEYQRNKNSIEKEAACDGFYVIRTSVPENKLSKEDVVRNYKDLSRVEQLFRTLKGVNIQVRPIRHRLEERVRSHFFICMLAYYVQWHMKKLLAPLLFEDEEIEANRKVRDAVKPAKPSDSAKAKKAIRATEDGLPVQSFKSLIMHLATRTKNECHIKPLTDANGNKAIIYQYSELTPLQKKAFSLLKLRTQ
jgi:transposase